MSHGACQTTGRIGREDWTIRAKTRLHKPIAVDLRNVTRGIR
jgi:hypothetical protein